MIVEAIMAQKCALYGTCTDWALVESYALCVLVLWACHSSLDCSRLAADAPYALRVCGAAFRSQRAAL